MVDIFKDFEFLWVVDCHFDPQAAEFIIHLDAVGLHFEFNPPAFWTFTVIGDCFSQKLCIKFTSKKRKNIRTFEVVECVTNQGWINILQSIAALKHDIGCVLALVHAPVIALVENLFYRIKIRIYFMGKEIKLTAEASGIKSVCQFLCFGNVADFKERIRISFKKI